MSQLDNKKGALFGKAVSSQSYLGKKKTLRWTMFYLHINGIQFVKLCKYYIGKLQVDFGVGEGNQVTFLVK